jgi:hypothetical protein
MQCGAGQHPIKKVFPPIAQIMAKNAKEGKLIVQKEVVHA